MEAIALHDFIASTSNEDELPFKKTNILKVSIYVAMYVS